MPHRKFRKLVIEFVKDKLSEKYPGGLTWKELRGQSILTDYIILSRRIGAFIDIRGPTVTKRTHEGQISGDAVLSRLRIKVSIYIFPELTPEQLRETRPQVKLTPAFTFKSEPGDPLP